MTAMNQFVADKELQQWLGESRLPYILEQLTHLLEKGAETELNLRDFLIMLCRHERDGKCWQRLSRNLAQARFHMQRTLVEFDFDAQPSVNPDAINDPVGPRWIANGENVLLLGPSGVGKTHLTSGLGHAAVEADCSELFVTAQSLEIGMQWFFVVPSLLVEIQHRRKLEREHGHSAHQKIVR